MKSIIELIVVSHYSSEYVIALLNSMKFKSLSFISRINVICNGGTDCPDYNEIVSIPKISTIEAIISESNKNVGFGAANNLLAKTSNAEFILFLNPDTLIVEDFTGPIIRFMLENRKAGACAPMLVYEDGKYQDSTGFRFGFLYELIEALMIISIYRGFMKRTFKKNLNSKTQFRVGWVSAACLLIRRSVFEEIGGFDEDFFLNYEDLDLCRRLEEAGYENYYFPKYKCIHLDHKSFGNDYEKLVLSRYESRLIFAKKHYNYLQRQIIRLVHILTILLRIISGYFLFKGEVRQSRQKGYFRALQLYLR